LKKIALRDILIDMRLSGSGCLDMTLCCEPGKTVRPAEVLKQVFALTAETLEKAAIRKLKALSRRDGTACFGRTNPESGNC
jgi:hypothetical protein